MSFSSGYVTNTISIQGVLPPFPSLKTMLVPPMVILLTECSFIFNYYFIGYLKGIL